MSRSRTTAFEVALEWGAAFVLGMAIAEAGWWPTRSVAVAVVVVTIVLGIAQWLRRYEP